MSTITCTRRLTFEAGHRVFGHESKCSSLHGHGYKVEIEAAAPLDAIGRVIDFSVLKEKIGGWIDAYWDHATILFHSDYETIAALEALGHTKLYLLPLNPTAENLARYLLEVVCPLQLHGTGVTVIRVVIHETANCQAEARL